MNHDNDSYARDGDPQVSAAYRELADERSPEKLDTTVLAQAAAAGAGRNVLRGFSAWFRPLAFVATAFLSLALILEFSQMNETQVPRMPAANETGGIAPRQDKAEALPDVPDSESRDSDVAVRETSLEPTSNLAAEAVPSADSPATEIRPAVPAQGREAAAASDLEAAATTAGSRLQQVNMQAGRLRSEEQSAAPAAAYSTAVEPSPGVRDEGRSCSVEASRNADAWWACIESLRRAGNVDDANAEVALLQAVFPDFAMPE